MSVPTPIPPEIPVVPDPQPEIDPHRINDPEIPPPLRDPITPPGPDEPEVPPDRMPPEVPPAPEHV